MAISYMHHRIWKCALCMLNLSPAKSSCPIGREDLGRQNDEGRVRVRRGENIRREKGKYTANKRRNREGRQDKEEE